MVHQNKFVVAIKCQGKILREINDIVTLPFGSEYSILIKNLNSVKAVVSVEVDGESATKDGRIILNSNESIDLLGIKEGLNVKNRFKFIKKTDEISEHRGDRVDDGIVRVEYTFEKIWEPLPQIWHYNHYYQEPKAVWDTVYYNTAYYNSIGSNTTSVQARCCNDFQKESTEDGITVKGSDCNQGFTYGNIGTLENTSHVITLMLKGTDSNKVEVDRPQTVNMKVNCTTCGRTNKSSNKFCFNCGTRLV